MTATTSTTTVRQALRIVRADVARMKDEGRNYLSGNPRYACDRGTLLVRNAPASDGGLLLGCFVAELVGPRGETVKTYKV